MFLYLQQTQWFFNGNFLVDTIFFQSGGIRIFLIKSPFNRIHTYNSATKIESTPFPKQQCTQKLFI